MTVLGLDLPRPQNTTRQEFRNATIGRDVLRDR